MLNQVRCSCRVSQDSWCCSWQSMRNAVWMCMLARELAAGNRTAPVSSILPPSKCSLPINVKAFKKEPTWQHPKMPSHRMRLGKMMLAEGYNLLCVWRGECSVLIPEGWVHPAGLALAGGPRAPWAQLSPHPSHAARHRQRGWRPRGYP